MIDFKRIIGNQGELVEHMELKHFTTWKVGGVARYIFFPFNENILEEIMSIVAQENIPYRVIGRGSNMLISDAPFDGMIIILTKLEDKILQSTANRFVASAGFGMQQFSRYLAKENYKGHEFFSGIPGSIGGGIVMNAGTPKGEFKDVLVQAKVISPEGEIKWVGNDELEFSYRSSLLKKERGFIVLAGDFFFEKEREHEVGTAMEQVKQDKLTRREKQPIDKPNGGSVFKNPKEGFAGAYVEKLNLKGYQIGGAMISPKHANFIVNTGDATAQDIYELIRYIQKKVYNEFNIALETEVELFNFDTK